MRSICLYTNVLVDVLFGANTRKEVQRSEALSADAVTRWSGWMTALSGLPDRDVFGLPIP